jgi:hypothetical protein
MGKWNDYIVLTRLCSLNHIYAEKCLGIRIQSHHGIFCQFTELWFRILGDPNEIIALYVSRPQQKTRHKGWHYFRVQVPQYCYKFRIWYQVLLVLNHSPFSGCILGLQIIKLHWFQYKEECLAAICTMRVRFPAIKFRLLHNLQNNSGDHSLPFYNNVVCIMYI